MATDSVCEEPETTSTAAAPWDTVELPKPSRPTVTDVNGNERELTDFEMRKFEESKADTEMRRQAASTQAGTSTIDHTMRARPRVIQPLDANTIYGFQLSPSLHEERVFALAPDESDDVRGYLTDSTSFLSTTRTKLEQIDAAYKLLMQDKSIPPDQRSLKLEGAASKAFEVAYTSRAKVLDAITKKIDHTEGLLNKPLEAQAATPRSSELRAVLREMSQDKRNEAIRAAIAAEKPTAAQLEILQCVLGSHHLTCGITEVEQTLHVRRFNERTQPQIQRRLDLLKKSLAIIEGIDVKTITSQFEGAMRSKFSRATAIRGISDKAQAALDAITR